MFVGRDGVIRHQLAEIEKEHRGGYNWFGNWGKHVLEQYAAWQRHLRRN